ncbi:MAG: hypothetical protein Q7S17_09150 [Xanthobacteraceae bacterium]|nr:hypothetical protein [Xanthobacteraceae bacterium]
MRRFVTTRRHDDGALFVPAGVYHHPIALNVREGRNGPLPPEHAAGLVQFITAFPDRAAIAAIRAGIEAAGLSPAIEGGGFLVRDPWRCPLRVRAAPLVD